MKLEVIKYKSTQCTVSPIRSRSVNKGYSKIFLLVFPATWVPGYRAPKISVSLFSLARVFSNGRWICLPLHIFASLSPPLKSKSAKHMEVSALHERVHFTGIRASGKVPPGTGDFQMMKTSPCQAIFFAPCLNVPLAGRCSLLLLPTLGLAGIEPTTKRPV